MPTLVPLMFLLSGLLLILSGVENRPVLDTVRKYIFGEQK